MAIEDLEINKDNLVNDTYLSVVSNVMEVYNNKLKNNEIETDEASKILSQINEAYSFHTLIRQSIR